MRYIVAVTLLVGLAYAEEKWQPSEFCPFPSNDQIRSKFQGDCSQYWECYQGARYVMQCGAGLEFNDITHKCDIPDVAKCDRDALVVYPKYPHDPYDPNSPSQKWQPDLLCPFPSNDLYRTKYQGDCSKYWECYQGARYAMTCAQGLEYNAAEHRCDVPDLARCNKDAPVDYVVFPHDPYNPDEPNSPDSPNSDPDSPNSDAPQDPQPENPGQDLIPNPLCPSASHDIVFLADPNDCSKYLECFEGHQYRMSCPTNLYWNQAAGYCDYLENVICYRAPEAPKSPDTPDSPDAPNSAPDTPDSPDTPDNVEPEPENPQDSVPDPLCASQSQEFVYYPDLSDCSKYLTCYEGKTMTFSCPSGLYWNDVINNCDFLAHVNCERKPEIPPQDPVPDPLCATQSQEFVYYPDLNDCSKYLTCYEGKTMTLSCPSGLYWNDVINNCDFLAHVNCDRSPKSPDAPDTPDTADTPDTPNAEPENPPQDSVPDPLCSSQSQELVFYPDISDCAQYLLCYEGSLLKFSCPSGLYWNDVINNCDYLANVNCNRSPKSPDTPASPDTPDTPDSPNADPESPPQEWVSDPLCASKIHELVFYPDSNDCSKYLECYEGKMIRMNCPYGLYWNDVTDACDYLENVNCNRSPPKTPDTPDSPNADPESPPQEWVSDPLCASKIHELVFYPDPSDCAKYLECFEGKMIKMNCAKGLYWNDVTNICDYLENVNCNRSPPKTPDTPDSPNADPESPPQEWVSDPLCASKIHELVFYPDSNDCSKYLECYEGKMIRMNCPYGLYWNDVTDACDYLENVNCNRSPPKTPDTPDSPNADPESPPQEWVSDPLCASRIHELVFYPDPSDCAKYLECFEGKMIRMNCAKGLYWNDVTNNCDYLENVNCNRSPNVPDSPNTDPESPPQEWVSDPLCATKIHELVFYPDPSDCSKYLECYEGKMIKMNCPYGLYWNDVTEACDYLENVKCNRSPDIPDSPDSPNSDPESPPQEWVSDPLCASQSHELVFHPDPNDCTKYLECYEGKIMRMNCPYGLYWNDVSNTCDYLTNVKCNRSPTVPDSPNSPDTPDEAPDAPEQPEAPKDSDNPAPAPDVPVQPDAPKDSDNDVPNAPEAPDAPANPIPDPVTLCVNQPDGTYIANPNDCMGFYDCVRGEAVPGRCGTGLRWNQRILNCDYEANVRC